MRKRAGSAIGNKAVNHNLVAGGELQSVVIYLTGAIKAMRLKSLLVLKNHEGHS